MPEVADLPLVDQIGERAERLVDVGVRVGAVDLVEVDPIRVQAPQGVLDAPDDAAPGSASPAEVIAHREADLGRQHDVLALAAGQGLADDLLGLTGGVDVGGVDEVDAGVERSVDDPDRFLVVGLTPSAEHHRAEAQL